MLNNFSVAVFKNLFVFVFQKFDHEWYRCFSLNVSYLVCQVLGYLMSLSNLGSFMPLFIQILCLLLYLTPYFQGITLWTFWHGWCCPTNLRGSVNIYSFLFFLFLWLGNSNWPIFRIVMSSASINLILSTSNTFFISINILFNTKNIFVFLNIF